MIQVGLEAKADSIERRVENPLCGISMFSSACASSRREWVPSMRELKLPPNVEFIREGEPADVLYVLLKGKIALVASDGGRDTTLGFLTAPAVCGLAAALIDGPHLHSAHTLSDSELVTIPSQAIRDAAGKDREFARSLIAQLARDQRDAVKDCKNVRLRSAIDRVAHWVISENRFSGSRGIFKLTIEKQWLASRLNLRPEHLSRALARLAKFGVKVDGPIIRVLDHSRLEQRFRPSPLIDDPETAAAADLNDQTSPICSRRS
jgi:CRP/FNR family transcriptional regulator, transcriptional activator FtrB